MVEEGQIPQVQKCPPEFIDVFAGCGGLSLGLMQAGWRGLFAIEKSPMAFETLKYNLVDQDDKWRFDWPEWLPAEAIDIAKFIQIYSNKLKALKGIPLLAGGPPCQGFSRAGRRKSDDERNYLIGYYLKLVELLDPKLLLIENVSAFAKDFDKTERGKNGIDLEEDPFNADKEVQRALCALGYWPFVLPVLKAKDFGVPQLRPRYILIGIREKELGGPIPNPFRILDGLHKEFLSTYQLPVTNEVTLQDAISDLLQSHGSVSCKEPKMKRFQQGLYGPITGAFQGLMRKNRDGTVINEGEVADSHRFPNHRQNTINRFNRILKEFRPGIQLSEEQLELLGLNKHRVAPLAANEACHTLTGLPDDLVHYSEPRIPTVREYARIQSFPDWFKFKSNYTSGGKRRRIEVPRYTQAANAVPPLLAEALGKALLQEYLYLLDVSQMEDDLPGTPQPEHCISLPLELAA